MDCTEEAHGKYYFEASIPLPQRAECIEAAERILSGQKGGDIRPEYYIFTENRFDRVALGENRLYQPLGDWHSPEFAANVLLAYYGQGSHYGLAYGYACYLLGEARTPEALSVPEETGVYDLNLLCFDESFVSPGDASLARTVAQDFVTAYIHQQGEESLQALLAGSGTGEGMAAVTAALEEYYRGYGVEYSPSPIRYGYGGGTFSYIVYSNLGSFYVGRDWRDANYESNPMVSERFLRESYADTKAFFETNLTQMEQYQTLFGLEHYDNALRIVFLNGLGSSRNSYYQSGTHRILVENVDSLMHEYIHALTQPRSSMALWETEGFARYFSYRYDAYGIAFLNQDYNSMADTEATRYVHEYLSAIGRPIDMAVDYAALENVAVWSRSYADPNANYLAGSSFVQYLVREYGETAVIDHIYGSGAPLGKDYDTLVAQWNQYIEDTCHSYSKYN